MRLRFRVIGRGPGALHKNRNVRRYTFQMTFHQPAGQKPEATSLLGKPLFPPPLADAAGARMEADRAAAFSRASAEPSADNIVWLGRRTAYLGKFREAITVFSGGLSQYPEDPRFLRHRGHR